MNRSFKFILISYLVVTSFQSYTSGQVLQDTSIDLKINGNGTTHRFGHLIQAIGDVNGDGTSEFIVGTDYQNVPTNLLTKIYIFSGNLQNVERLDLTEALSIIILNNTLRYSVTNFFDLNQDGLDDFGIWQDNRIYVFFGKPTWPDVLRLDEADFVIFNSDSSWNIHHIMSTGLDFNSDGIVDLAISQSRPTNNSDTISVNIVSVNGRSNFEPLFDLSSLDSADNIFIDNLISSTFITKPLASVDFLIVEDLERNDDESLIISFESKIYIFDIASKNQRNLGLNDSIHYLDFVNDTLNLNFPLKILNIGDVNGDSLVDIMIYGTERSTYKGIQYILFGGFSLLNPSELELSSDVRITGKSWAGIGDIDRLGDVNGDGINDFGTSHPFPLNSKETSVYIFYGKNSINRDIELQDASLKITGNVSTGFGQAITGINDVDGDLTDDYLISAPASFGNQGAVIIKLSRQINGENQNQSPLFIIIPLMFVGIIILLELRYRIFRRSVVSSISTYSYNRSFNRKRKALLALMVITDNQQSIPVHRLVEILDLPEQRVEVIITHVLNENPMMGKYDKIKKIYIKGSKAEMYLDYLLKMMDQDIIPEDNNNSRQ